jgi:hypothetical protein
MAEAMMPPLIAPVVLFSWKMYVVYHYYGEDGMVQLAVALTPYAASLRRFM